MSFNDPLTNMHYKDTLDTTDTDSLGPLTNELYYKNEDKSFQSSERSHKMQDAKNSLKQFSYNMVATEYPEKLNQKYGFFMSSEDQDRIKEFVSEFCVHGILPHIEKLMRNISEQVSNETLNSMLVYLLLKWHAKSEYLAFSGI